MLIESRPRRNRKSKAIRNLVRENKLTVDDLIAPLFIIDGQSKKEEISTMPGVYRYSLDILLLEIAELVERGINCISLFPALDDSLKDRFATESTNPDGLYLKSIREIKSKFPELILMTDVAMDPYSSEGHDGVVNLETGEIENDSTLEILGKMAIAQAQAGSDIIGPSDMMDGRVGYIRDALDRIGYTDTTIMSYSAKYASSFYGPFRDALDSAPKNGDKKTYQMDFANSNEAVREMLLDEKEGADIIMIKPGLCYLDIISKLKMKTNLPIAAYNVSGEYSMIKAASERGMIDENMAIMETLTAFKRAGADMILTYFAKQAAELIGSQRC